MKIKIRKIIISTILLSLFVLPVMVQAGMIGSLKNTAKPAGFEVDDTDDKTLAELVGVIIGTFLALLGVLFISLMIYGGIMWMTDAGNNERAQKAKDIIRSALIGLVLTVSSYGIWAFIFEKLLGGTG